MFKKRTGDYVAVEFRDKWLEAYYEEDKAHKKIPTTIEASLYRKLQILDAATQESDLRVPPGNRFEHLQGNLSGWCSIRVNKQYRLIFRWEDDAARNTYLDSHVYKG
jgi:proteic killer suppression protein